MCVQKEMAEPEHVPADVCPLSLIQRPETLTSYLALGGNSSESCRVVSRRTERGREREREKSMSLCFMIVIMPEIA